jgi:hypothetical protein
VWNDDRSVNYNWASRRDGRPAPAMRSLGCALQQTMKTCTVVIIAVLTGFTTLLTGQAGELFSFNYANRERRIALVVGNARYSPDPLANPANDAEDMAQALEQLGFTVINRSKMLNLTKDEMKKAISGFGVELRKGGVGLFYFAGHGVQVNGDNYLIPIGARIESEEDIEYEAVEAGRVLAEMQKARNPLNIVILDACRDNPFARGFRSAFRGLALMKAPTGALVAYSTAPGSTASDGGSRNGLYTEELLRVIRTRGIEIETVFKRVRESLLARTANKQIPWESTSLVGSFYFATENTPTIATAATPVHVENGGFEQEFDGWGTGFNESLTPFRLVGSSVFWALSDDVNITGAMDSVVRKSGMRSFKIVNRTPKRPHAYRTLSQRIGSLKPDSRYRLSFWVRAENLSPGALKVVTDPEWNYGMAMDPGTYDWREYIVEVRTGAAENGFDIRIVSEGLGTAWFDDITVRQVS